MLLWMKQCLSGTRVVVAVVRDWGTDFALEVGLWTFRGYISSYVIRLHWQLVVESSLRGCFSGCFLGSVLCYNKLYYNMTTVQLSILLLVVLNVLIILLI